MQCSTLVQLTVGIALAALLVLAAILPSEAQVRRLVFASAGFNESNCFWIIGLRPTEEWIRTSYWSQGPVHHFEDPFIDEPYLQPTQTVDANERQRLAREIGDHLFEEFADLPLLLLYNEVMANPKVVAEWTYPGLGAGRTTHFHLLKAAK